MILKIFLLFIDSLPGLPTNFLLEYSGFEKYDIIVMSYCHKLPFPAGPQSIPPMPVPVPVPS